MLGFNKYLLEWNHPESSETMKVQLFVNTFILESAMLSVRALQTRLVFLPCLWLEIQDVYLKLFVYCHL